MHHFTSSVQRVRWCAQYACHSYLSMARVMYITYLTVGTHEDDSWVAHVTTQVRVLCAMRSDVLYLGCRIVCIKTAPL